jgi:hypothetical protein
MIRIVPAIAAWALVVATAPGFSTPRSEVETDLFRDVAAASGLAFTHINGAAGRYHLPEIMGAGGALFDYDLDGDLDVLLLQGRALEGPTGDTSGHRLFRNELAQSGGTLRFIDVTDRAGFAKGDYGMGVATGDYDGDGDPDLYITCFGANRLYRNNRDGTFTDVTSGAGAGLDEPRWSSSAAFADYDADGDLDLFVVNYVDFTVAGAKACQDAVGIRDYCGPLQFRPVPDRLFRNNGDGTFADVSEPSGITRAYGSGLGVVAADFNGDRRLDFYVANDGMRNHLWILKGDGTFEESALLAGVAVTADGQVEGSMGIAADDADNDGDVDLFVTNIMGETHAFYENLGGGRFEDRRLITGLAAATRPYTGFGTDWFDYDNDGWLDLYVANGAVTIVEALRGDRFPFRQPNQLLRNTGNRRFTDVSAAAGPALALSEVSRGAAFGDADNDGDMDILVTNNGGPVRLLRNDASPRGRWIEVQLEGVTDNRQGLGARVGVVRGDGSVLWRRARTDGSYLSSSDARIHVGLGTDERVDGIVVEWLRGSRERWPTVRAGGITTLRQGTGTPVAEPRF